MTLIRSGEVEIGVSERERDPVFATFWIAGVALLPVYVFPSGGIQPAHALLALAAFWAAATRGVLADRVDAVLFVLLCVVTFREGIAVMQGAPLGSLMPPLYLAYNLLLVASIRRMARTVDLVGLAPLAIILSALVALGGLLTFGFALSGSLEEGRPVGSFNNPNQLGYYAVCLLALALLFWKAGRLRSVYAMLIVALAFLLAAISLSKAALLACAVGMVVMWIGLARGARGLGWGALGGALFVLLGFKAYTAGAFDSLLFAERLERIGRSADDTLAARGYMALSGAAAWEWLLGLGRAQAHVVVGHEIHSTIFSFFGRYGLVGGALFCGFLGLCFVRVTHSFGIAGAAMVLAPPMVYGLAHNGSRFTAFWILIAVSLVLSEMRDRGRYAHQLGHRPGTRCLAPLR